MLLVGIETLLVTKWLLTIAISVLIGCVVFEIISGALIEKREKK